MKTFAEKNENTKKNEEEKQKNEKEKFNKYFENEKGNTDNNQIKYVSSDKQTTQDNIRITNNQNNLMTATRDYTNELLQINQSNIMDPNIPTDDAIQAKNYSLRDINTVHMIVGTIKDMKKQIAKLQTDNEKLNMQIDNFQKQFSTKPATRNIPTEQPSREQRFTRDNLPELPQSDPENEKFLEQKTKNNRNRIKNKIEVTQLSPGPGEIDESGTTPPIAYAKILTRNLKPPKTKINEEFQNQIEQQGAIFQEKNDEIENQNQLNQEQIKILKEEISKSSHIIGVKPITNQHIQAEIEKILVEGKYNKKTEYNKIKSAATKNALFRYFKNELKIDEKTRNSLTIETIFPSKNENSDILYVQCTDQDDIMQITSRAVNLNSNTSQRQDLAIVPHIPKIMFDRYQSLEKLAYQIRCTDKGNLRTNIRLAKSDFLLRVKYKNDTTPWKNITPLIIPEHIPKPNLTLLKNENPTTGNENQPKTIPKNTPKITTPTRQNLWTHFLDFQGEQNENENDQINTNGTMTGLLQSNKRTTSPIEEKNDQKKKK